MTKIRRSKNKELESSSIDKSNEIMSSNLPLLFAKGQPRSLDTISGTELEQFIPFMILCSLGQELHRQPSAIHTCKVPKWWPVDFPFKFPLCEQSEWMRRQKTLKRLVCRCYTYHNCEFLLKFSSELADKSPSRLKYEDNEEDNITSIYDETGSLLVRCRNENLEYDKVDYSHLQTEEVKQRKAKIPLIDLTCDTSSEDEKEVNLKEGDYLCKAGKRKGSELSRDEPASKRCGRRLNNFRREETPPRTYNEAEFLNLFGLIPRDKPINDNISSTPKTVLDRKKKFAHNFTLLSFSSIRGQKLLAKNKQVFNPEPSLERIEKYCCPPDQQDSENGQVCTRASATLGAMIKHNLLKSESQMKAAADNHGWVHTYKWPKRNRRCRYPQKGPTVKPCYVKLYVLSEETIKFWTKRRRSVATITPDEWSEDKVPICVCRKILVVDLDDEDERLKYKNKSSSTRCQCNESKIQSNPARKSYLDIKNNSNLKIQINPKSEFSVQNRHRNASKNPARGSERFNLVSGSGSANSNNLSLSCDKIKKEAGTGISEISYNSLHQSESSHNSIKKALHRKPLAVVPPTVIVSRTEIPHVLLNPMSYAARNTPISAIKNNFFRSVADAIKWYGRNNMDLGSVNVLPRRFTHNDDFERLQENIKPLTELNLPDSNRKINYFLQDLDITALDYCFERQSDGASQLVTRRGERHYPNREPCLPCFRGKDKFCVYEFIRQAKLAGVILNDNQRELQVMFFNFIQAVNSQVSLI